ncbi:MAG: ATP-dependent zinc metalloprotease FtsH, partial [Oscillospiraceae bacterium]|nr:ATP-dependent zinc metalloprotease FtsH [Oscillospiraceae bacterium]
MKHLKNISFYIILLVIVIFVATLWSGSDKPREMQYSSFLRELNNGTVASVELQGDEAIVTLNAGGQGDAKATRYVVYVPSIIEFTKVVSEAVAGNKLNTFQYKPPMTAPWWMAMIPTLAVIIIFIVFWVFFMQQSQGGGGSRVMSFGKSRAKLAVDDKRKITFTDLAGMEEEKEELREIVEFLKHPKRFVDLGARIPKGVLMVGPPGTGKTYLARAVAGEADAPFLSISGSDFVEMFVGVGASRVRDLFEQAKKNSPSIIFIDEIDAVGRHRGAGLGGGHDEREQTLNQLLVEMDGFGVNEGVIILAATNRPDILDPALLRPGRFDRRVAVGLPDVKGREAILRLHCRNKPLDGDVDLADVAKTTPGFTPADLENLLNEASLLAARQNNKSISLKDIKEANFKVIVGPEKKSKTVSPKERRITAYHEAGHALATRLLSKDVKVDRVSIIPSGAAGGYTVKKPEEDMNYYTKAQILESIMGAMGGRA